MCMYAILCRLKLSDYTIDVSCDWILVFLHLIFYSSLQQTVKLILPLEVWKTKKAATMEAMTLTACLGLTR